MMELSDDDLVQMYREGDADAFEALFGRYYVSVYNFACAMLRDSHQAEEVLQEAFVAVVRNAERYVARGQFRAWLMRIARNRCLNRLAAEKSLRFVMGDDALAVAAPVSGEPSPAAALESGDRQAFIRAAVADLPARQREAISLYAFEQMPYLEIAHVMEMPVNTVKTLIHRARATLASRLASAREEGGYGL